MLLVSFHVGLYEDMSIKYIKQKESTGEFISRKKYKQQREYHGKKPHHSPNQAKILHNKIGRATGFKKTFLRTRVTSKG